MYHPISELAPWFTLLYGQIRCIALYKTSKVYVYRGMVPGNSQRKHELNRLFPHFFCS